MDQEPPHIFFRNMVFALLGLFLVGMALIFHAFVVGHSSLFFLWWAGVTGGVPAGAWIIWQNLRARVTGERLPIDVLLVPFVGAAFALATAVLLSAFAFGI